LAPSSTKPPPRGVARRLCGPQGLVVLAFLPGQRERLFAARQRRQPARAQRLVVAMQQRPGRQQRTADQRLGRQRTPALLEQQRGLRQAAAAAAISLRQTQAGPAQRSHLAPARAVVTRRAATPVAQWPALFVAGEEIRTGVAQHALLVAEVVELAGQVDHRATPVTS
jgi:hypothetical protein